jgi:hypothetical protein
MQTCGIRKCTIEKIEKLMVKKDTRRLIAEKLWFKSLLKPFNKEIIVSALVWIKTKKKICYYQ